MSYRQNQAVERKPYVPPTLTRPGTVAEKTLGVPFWFGEPILGLRDFVD